MNGICHPDPPAGGEGSIHEMMNLKWNS